MMFMGKNRMPSMVEHGQESKSVDSIIVLMSPNVQREPSMMS